MTREGLKEAPLEKVLAELRKGNMVIVVDDAQRENEGDLLMAAEFVRSEDVNFMAQNGRGLICQAITPQRAAELQLEPMVKTNNSLLNTAFTVSVDAAEKTSTGISASDRAETIARIIDPNTSPSDLLRPGHIFPLVADHRGLQGRRGHTEASIDLMQLAGLYPSAVICEIMNSDGTMARATSLNEFAHNWGIPLISIARIVESGNQLTRKVGIQRITETALPSSYGNFRIISYFPECYVLTKGLESNAQESDTSRAPLVRIHSECLTGESFGSLRCDCGYQLHTAMSMIEKEGMGAVIYLRQEGRGVGLLNKLRAYALQDEGLDTFSANQALHLPLDAREYSVATWVLRDLGINKFRLLTNNPQKIEALGEFDFEVIPLESKPNEHNKNYLSAKKNISGHNLQYVS